MFSYANRSTLPLIWPHLNGPVAVTQYYRTLPGHFKDGLNPALLRKAPPLPQWFGIFRAWTAGGRVLVCCSPLPYHEVPEAIKVQTQSRSPGAVLFDQDAKHEPNKWPLLIGQHGYDGWCYLSENDLWNGLGIALGRDGWHGLVEGKTAGGKHFTGFVRVLEEEVPIGVQIRCDGRTRLFHED